ncbi:hypothetical protein [Mesorhizobium sp. 10J20-29]
MPATSSASLVDLVDSASEFFALLAGHRFFILSTSYVIPNFLTAVQGFDSLQMGRVLLGIVLPQVLLVVPLAFVLARIDPHWVLGAGTALIVLACLMAGQLTSVWSTSDFLYSQVLQAVGQSCALTSLVVITTRIITPAQAVTGGLHADQQTARRRGRSVVHAELSLAARAGSLQSARTAF